MRDQGTPARERRMSVRVRAPSGRIWPQNCVRTRPGLTAIQNGLRNPASAGLARPSANSRPDCQLAKAFEPTPRCWSGSSRHSYCMRHLTRGSCQATYAACCSQRAWTRGETPEYGSGGLV